jgi:hypothetical protein
MPQIFSPSADTWLKIFFLAAVLVVVAFLLVAAGYVRSDYLTGAGWVLNQPIPFSHEHHVSGLGIDCRYCHTGVETSADAGIPSSYTCMTCHSQIWTGAAILEPLRQSLSKGAPLHWNRVAKLPDYVYFNHSVHIHAGVGCVTCHGPVDRMPLTWRAHAFVMQFCIDCHRDPAPRLRPREEVTDMTWSTDADRRELGHRLMTEYGVDPKRLTDCYVCHR